MIPLRPDRLPQELRLAAYAVAVAALLYLTLAPAEALPRESLWDKANHAIAWCVLTGVGLAFWPRRPGRLAGFALGIGVVVEILQASLPFGRNGEPRDLLADAVGIGLALAGWRLVRGVAAIRRPSPAPRA